MSYYIPNIDIKAMINDPLAKKKWLWFFNLIGITLALLSPENVLEKTPILAVITNFSSAIIPSINRWSSYSIFPEVTKLLLTYFWLTIPFQLLIIVRHKESEISFVENYFANPKTKNLKPFSLIFVLCGFFWVSFFIAIPESQPCSICIYNSRIVQGLLASALAFIDASLFALVIWWLKNIRTIHFDKKEEVIQ